MNVEYRLVPNFPGYRVGNDGSMWTNRTAEDWVRLNGSVSSRGYRIVSLVKPSGERINRPVHQFVLESFVGTRPPGMEACHNNGCKLDNRPENLRWDTHAANIADQGRLGERRRGETVGMSKLVNADLPAIFFLHHLGMSRLAIGSIFGVHACQISRILSGDGWEQVRRGMGFDPVQVKRIKIVRSITEEIARQIREERARLGTPFVDLGEKYGIGTSHAWRIATGKAWKHVS